MAGELGSVNYRHALLSPCFFLSGEKQSGPDLRSCRCLNLEHLRKGLRHLDVLFRRAGQAAM